MAEFDFANMENADYVEQMWSAYREDPQSVDRDWRAFFAGFEFAGSEPVEKRGREGINLRGADALVTAYRRMGHLVAHLAPISYERPPHPLLDLAEYGFSESDLGSQVGACGFMGTTDGTLGDLIEKLQATYCRSLGVDQRPARHVRLPGVSCQRLANRSHSPSRTGGQAASRIRAPALRR